MSCVQSSFKPRKFLMVDQSTYFKVQTNYRFISKHHNLITVKHLYLTLYLHNHRLVVIVREFHFFAHRPVHSVRHHFVPEHHALAHLVRYHHDRGDAVAQEEQEEEPAQNWHLPCGLFVITQVVQNYSVGQLEAVQDEETGEQERKSLPHPSVETFDGDVHVVPLT